MIEKIVRERIVKKSRLNKSHAQRRKKFCENTLKKLANEAIYICNDEKYYEVETKSSDKNVTRSKEVIVERCSISKTSIQFTIMQFESHTIKEKLVMNSIHL